MSTRLKRRVIAKTAAYTIVSVNDAPGTIFTNRGAGGSVTITLPAPNTATKGDWYELRVHADQSFILAAASANTLVAPGDVAADNVGFQIASKKIGRGLFVECDGTQWYAYPLGAQDGFCVDGTEFAPSFASGTALASPTLTSPTLSSITNSDVKALAADATATSSVTLTALTGFSWTLVAGATYVFRVRGKVGMSTNGGLALAFKYTTLTLTSIVVNALQRTASALALAQSTTTTDQTKFIDQKATAYIEVELYGSLVVNAGGTLAVQFAQNTSHGDTTTIYKGFEAEFIRTS